MFWGHREHKIQSLKETLADISKEVDICLQHLKSLRVRENQTVTVNKIDQVKEAKANLIICIKKHADHLRKQIDEDEQLLITKVEQQTVKLLDSLNDEKCLQDRELFL
jgi:nitrogenase molybdenum-iron protein alpha/beta subunit